MTRTNGERDRKFIVSQRATPQDTSQDQGCAGLWFVRSANRARSSTGLRHLWCTWSLSLVQQKVKDISANGAVRTSVIFALQTLNKSVSRSKRTFGHWIFWNFVHDKTLGLLGFLGPSQRKKAQRTIVSELCHCALYLSVSKKRESIWLPSLRSRA